MEEAEWGWEGRGYSLLSQLHVFKWEIWVRESQLWELSWTVPGETQDNVGFPAAVHLFNIHVHATAQHTTNLK